MRTPQRETTEQMLSRMAQEYDELWAINLNVDVGKLWQRRFFCNHEWENKGLYDDCKLCGEPRVFGADEILMEI